MDWLSEQWIVIPKWDGGKGTEGFQHYKDRDPIWIKNYRELLAHDDYRDLSFHLRGILHGLWLAYAASNRQLRVNPKSLSKRLGHTVKTQDLERLNHAGFITFAASKPRARRYQAAKPEKSRLEKNPPTPLRGNGKGPRVAIATLIQNGVITDEIALEAELRAHPVPSDDASNLRALLAERSAAA